MAAMMVKCPLCKCDGVVSEEDAAAYAGLSADVTRLERERDNAQAVLELAIKACERRVSALTGALASLAEAVEGWAASDAYRADQPARACLQALPASSVVPVEAGTAEAESAQNADVRGLLSEALLLRRRILGGFERSSEEPNDFDDLLALIPRLATAIRGGDAS